MSLNTRADTLTVWLISTNRIIKLEQDVVTFKWRDYKDNSKLKKLTITAIEFIRRLLNHILCQQDLRKSGITVF
ncbi:MAG: transposase [Negativicutes bacterium]